MPIITDERTMRRFNARWKADPDTGCHIWTGATQKDGYAAYSTKRANRMAWELGRGPIPNGRHVCHKCDNPLCVNVAHLFLGTDADNTADKVTKGRQSRGERHSQAIRAVIPRGEGHYAVKFTDTTIAEIRRLYARGDVSQADLARRFGCSQPYMSRLVRKNRRQSSLNAQPTASPCR